MGIMEFPMLLRCSGPRTAVKPGLEIHQVYLTRRFARAQLLPTCYSTYNQTQALAAIGNALFVAPQDNYVYRSTDTGMTWKQDASGLTNHNFQCLATNGSTIFAGTDSGVFISKDTGTTWTASNSGLTNKNIQALFSTGPDLFAGTGGGGIFHSADSGKTWTPFNNGLTDSSIQSFGVNDTYLFAGAGPGTYGGSVWRYPLSQVSVKRAQLIRPELAGLKVHSMGRYNPAVSIDFSIPSPEKVSIGIYDLSGHLVTTLEDKLFVAGQHTLQWNARNAGSGCYVVRMQAGGACRCGRFRWCGNKGDAILPSRNDSMISNRMKIVAGIIIACLGIVMLFCQLVEAQWVKSILPYNNGFGIVALAANSSTIFASTDYGLFDSTNNDTCWTLVFLGSIKTQGLLSSPINGSTIIASSGWDGFFLSHDNGISWIKGD